jgi:hypothetical protein
MIDNFGIKINIIYSDFYSGIIKQIHIDTNFGLFYVFSRYSPNYWNSIIKFIEEELKPKSLRNLSYDEYWVKITLILFRALMESNEKRNNFVTVFQLLLQYLHYIDTLINPIEVIGILFFHLNRHELIGENGNNDRKYIEREFIERMEAVFSEVKEEFSERNFNYKKFINFFEKSIGNKTCPLFIKKNIYTLGPKLKSNLRFSYVLRTLFLKDFYIFAGNNPLFKLNNLGIKVALLELDMEIKIPKNVPDYLLESIPFENLSLVVLMIPSNHSNRIRNNYQRVLNIRLSRSLACYLLEELFVFRIRKKVGDFPVIERVLSFWNSKNKLKNLKKIPNFFNDYIKYWDYYSGKAWTFKKNYSETSLEEFYSIESSSVLNKQPDRELITNFPINTPLIIHQRRLLLYVKVIENQSQSTTKNSSNKYIHDVVNFLQYWSDLSIIYESVDSLYAQIIVPHSEEKILSEIKEYFKVRRKKSLVIYKIIDLNKTDSTKNRFFRQVFFPNPNSFDEDKFVFDYEFPTISRIEKDLANMR